RAHRSGRMAQSGVAKPRPAGIGERGLRMTDANINGGSLGALTVHQFLDRLASGEATPGGGSASALGGALGAPLVSMVCNLTLGREKYADTAADVEEIRTETTRLLATLQQGIDDDA